MIKTTGSSTNLKDVVLKIIGKLADETLSVSTKKSLLEELTTALKDKPFTEQAFHDIGIDSFITQKGDARILNVIVPKEYLTNNLAERKAPVIVEFEMAAVLDTDFRNR